MEALKADYTEVWAAAPNLPLIRFANRVRAISETGLSLLEIPDQDCGRTVESLRSFDAIVSWYGANRPEFADATRRLGLPIRLFPALPQGPEHAVDFYLGQARTLAANAPAARPRIPCSVAARRRLAVIHPYSSSKSKNWPLERFDALAQRIERQMPVEWTAGPDEPLDRARRFEDLYELGCWLASAALFIGNDSGIAHLAAAVGTPVVVLFGPTDPAVGAPRGECVVVLRRNPLTELRVQEVWDAVSRLC